jgi:hypothetical protein
MTRRDKLMQQIRFELSALPAIQDTFRTGNVPPGNQETMMEGFVAWIVAVQNAVLALADEVDALEVASGETGA